MNVHLTRCYRHDEPYDLAATFSMLSMGRGDPCLRLDGAGRARISLLRPEGPVSIAVHCTATDVNVDVAATGSVEWLLPRLPSFLGLDFRAPRFKSPRRLQALSHRLTGLRLLRLPVIFSRLVQIVLQQLVSFRDACDGWRMLVRRHGQPISGYDDFFAPPAATTLAKLAPADYVECGILPQQGRRIIGLSRVANRIEAAWGHGGSAESMDRTCRLLKSLRGVGPWTIGYLRGSSMGDSDAVVLGDYGFPKRVAYFFADNERADDEDMLRLLEPYRPHRFYVLSLLLQGGPAPPRRGPRPRSLRDRMRPRYP